MVIVGVDTIAAYSGEQRLKSTDWLRLNVGGHWAMFGIHEMNRKNSRNGCYFYVTAGEHNYTVYTYTHIGTSHTVASITAARIVVVRV